MKGPKLAERERERDREREIERERDEGLGQTDGGHFLTHVVIQC